MLFEWRANRGNNMKTRKIEEGERFKKLVVIKECKEKYTVSGRRVRMFQCKCDCGNISAYQMWHITSGHTTSCGCYKKIVNIKHNKSHSQEYNIWSKMLNRCRNEKNDRYSSYGGRGITVCESWKKFENFYSDMGDRPSERHSIDRIDNNKGYCKENCRWATAIEQQNNMRTNVLITFNKKTKTLSQWSRFLGITCGCLRVRLKRGWTLDRALRTKIQKHIKK